uniref:Putative voltage-dependent cation channel n=1 Tax=Monosiga brevicollis TaxID=81824 RepID=F6MHT5_MONBE|nr:putative voltage-dependent cation channel [Monosiga brevicollis]
MRQVAISVFVLSPTFDYFIFFIIVLNAIFMALSHPPPYAEYIFTAIYTIEMMGKMFAMGIVRNRLCYLREPFNILDAFVVALSYLTFIPSVGSYAAIRTLRVFRALRSITALPRLRAMVNSLWRCVVALCSVLTLLAFALILFSIISLQLYAGTLRHKCVALAPSGLSDAAWDSWIHNATHWATNADGDYLLCGNMSSARRCPSDYVCLSRLLPNPNYGFTSFDNMGAAALTNFQVLTLDFWEDVYNKVLETNGKGHLIIFIILVFVGCFFIINLVLAIVAMAYSREVKVEATRRATLASRVMSIAHAGFTDLPITRRLSTSAAALESENAETESIAPATRAQQFATFITIVIVLNTITLAMWYPQAPSAYLAGLAICNYVWTGIFVVELLIKLGGLGLRSYFASGWNRFDCLVVALSIVEIIIEATTDSSTGGLSILRSFRLLRVLKLARSWKTMQHLVGVVGRSLSDLLSLTIILLIIMYIFAVMGFQLFRTDYTRDKFEGELPRWNFEDFGHAFMVVFRVLCGEWIELLWETMHAAGYGAVVYYVIVLVVGNFVVLNLFLALLLSAFDVTELASVAGSSNSTLASSRSSLLSVSSNDHATISTDQDKVSLQGCSASTPIVLNEVNPAPRSEGIALAQAPPTVMINPQQESQNMFDQRNSAPGLLGPAQAPCLIQSVPLQASKKEGVDSVAKQSAPKGLRRLWTSKKIAPITLTSGESSGHSEPQSSPRKRMACCIWSAQCWASYKASRVKRAASRVVNHWLFETFIQVLILWSSIMLCFEDASLHRNDRLQQTLTGMNIFFTTVFVFEALLKIFAWGPYEYFRGDNRWWNRLDFFITLVSLIDLISAGADLTALRSLRTLRALRPLRAISRWEGMRVVVNALLSAIPAIANVLLVCALFWLIFAIVGVQFFGARFGRCVDADGELVPRTEVRSRADCASASSIAAGYTWVNPTVNFDNILNAFVALLQVATFEGWMEIMEAAVDAQGVDKQPQRETQFEAYIFFVVFIIFGGFFTLNLFIGVIIDTFNRLKAELKEGRNLFLTEGQQQFITQLQSALRAKPKRRYERPQRRWRGWCYDVATGPYLEPFIIGCIGLNAIVFCMYYYDEPAALTRFQTIINLVFAGIFTVEALIKIAALGRAYFATGWNRFDFCIVVLTFVGIVVEAVSSSLPMSPTTLRVLRLLRVIRVLRVVKQARGIQRLLTTMVMSAPTLLNIGTLLFVVLFVYAIVGMTLFAHVKFTGPVVDNFMNFRNFGNALVLLFRLSTGAGWNDVLEACSIQAPDCDPTYLDLPNGNCGDPLAAKFYFSTFVVVTFLILINMYIAVILENLAFVQAEEKLPLTSAEIEVFYEKWAHYDPDADRFILYHDLHALFAALPPPLVTQTMTWGRIAALNIPLYAGDKVHCSDVLHALIMQVVRQQDEEHLLTEEQIHQRVEDHMSRAFPDRQQLSKIGSTWDRLREQQAARRLQRHVRKWLEGRRAIRVQSSRK